MLRVYVYGDPSYTIVEESINLIDELGLERRCDPEGVDLCVAPLLLRKLTLEDLKKPRIGTLIFHPSLLPRHRGRDAIKWAFKLGETYTGATWFWADEGYDTGDICEQEVLEIREGETPGQFYERAVIPSALKLLGLLLSDMINGHVRRRCQREEAATNEPPIKKL